MYIIPLRKMKQICLQYIQVEAPYPNAKSPILNFLNKLNSSKRVRCGLIWCGLITLPRLFPQYWTFYLKQHPVCLTSTLGIPTHSLRLKAHCLQEALLDYCSWFISPCSEFWEWRLSLAWDVLLICFCCHLIIVHYVCGLADGFCNVKNSLRTVIGVCFKTSPSPLFPAQ